VQNGSSSGKWEKFLEQKGHFFVNAAQQQQLDVSQHVYVAE
jgi:hypothetical protein